MRDLYIRQIRTTLERTFGGKIDLSDVLGRSPSERHNAFLTRALAAYALAYLAEISEDTAIKALTDGYDDNGIDALYYHEHQDTLYLVQSKWHHSGKGSLTRADMLTFLKGVEDILNMRFNSFNAKVRTHASQIQRALENVKTRIVLVIVYTGQDPLSDTVKRDLNDAVNEINDLSDLASVRILRLRDVYSIVKQGIQGAPIDLKLLLTNWGQVRDPYVAIYGQVAASDIAMYYKTYHHRLFTPNIRMFLGRTEVNTAIIDTLLTSPEHFWYFNNGITALCRSISKLPQGGSDTAAGVFHCHDFMIVNGAQTVGAIAAAWDVDPDAVEKARVAIRVISLEACPPEFDKAVTRFTNTQNRIDRRDFAALDPQQDRIKKELEIEGIEYVYKSGESTTRPRDCAFDIIEATVARACRHKDVDLAVQAKREIGKLWEDTEKPPYRWLFNDSVSGPSLWRLVQLVRIIEDELETYRKQSGRIRLLAFHGNRFIAHLVLNLLPADELDSHDDIDTAIEERVRKLTATVFEEISRLIDVHYPDSYLGSLFKNVTKCRHLKNEFMRSLSHPLNVAATSDPNENELNSRSS